MAQSFDSLRAQFRKQEAPAKKRKSREAERVASADGRSLRATGRTAQLNLRCTPELRDLIKDYADRYKIRIVEVLEEAMALYVEAQKDG